MPPNPPFSAAWTHTPSPAQGASRPSTPAHLGCLCARPLHCCHHLRGQAGVVVNHELLGRPRRGPHCIPHHLPRSAGAALTRCRVPVGVADADAQQAGPVQEGDHPLDQSEVALRQEACNDCHLQGREGSRRGRRGVSSSMLRRSGQARRARGRKCSHSDGRRLSVGAIPCSAPHSTRPGQVHTVLTMLWECRTSCL